MRRLIVALAALCVALAVGCGSSSSTGPGGAKNGAPAPTQSSSSSGFTANCAIVGAVTGNPGYPAVTLSNPTSQDESVVGDQVNVIYFNQAGAEVGTSTVNTVSVIAAGQTVVSGSNMVSGTAPPEGTTSCSVGPYQISP
jgi:hypothetical protein